MTYSGKGNPNYRHGGHVYHRPEYNSWRAMRERCQNPKYWAYHLYGGRGIKVAERWLGREGFAHFLEDMGKKPAPRYSIDRIDRDGDYEPSNCRWNNQRGQMSHTSNSRYETIDGVTRTISEWCVVYDKTVSQVYNRLKSGWGVERALATPMNPNGVNFRS